MDPKKELEIGSIVKLGIGGPSMVISGFTYDTHYKKRLKEGEDTSMALLVRSCYAKCLWFNADDEMQERDILVDLLIEN